MAKQPEWTNVELRILNDHRQYSARWIHDNLLGSRTIDAIRCKRVREGWPRVSGDDQPKAKIKLTLDQDIVFHMRRLVASGSEPSVSFIVNRAVKAYMEE